MQRFKLSVIVGGLSLGLAGALLNNRPNLPAAKAQSHSIVEYVETDLVDRNRPSEGRRDGGASRNGSCTLATGAPNLTALVPAKPRSIANSVELSEVSAPDRRSSPSTYESVLSLTTQPYPVLWFYVPYALNETLTLELVVQDGAGNTLYQTEFVPATEGPGMVQIPLARDFPLASEERYNWYLNAWCDDEFLVYVEGWIERISLPADLRQSLADASPREQAALYAANGIWQDALTLVAERYQNTPQDPEAQADWASLIASIDFETATETAITQGTVLDCCDPPPSNRLQP